MRKLSQTPRAIKARRDKAAREAAQWKASREAHQAHLDAHMVVRADGSQVRAGDVVESSRGEKATFTRLSRAPRDGTGTNGKIVVLWLPVTEDHYGGEYYPSVFDLKVVPRG